MIPDNSQNYEDVSQGIDRITEILKQQSTPRTYSPYQPQAVNLPNNILNAIATSSYNYGNGGGNFMQNVQNYAHTQQADQIEQQKGILSAYEAKLKMGDAQTKALDEKISLFTGGDPEGRAMFLEALHNDPDPIDPANSYQVMTKLAGIAKASGYKSPELEMEKEAKRLGLIKTQAEINRLNKEAQTGGGSDPAALKLANEYDKARRAGDKQRMQDIIMFSKALEKGTTIGDDNTVKTIPGATDAIKDINAAKAIGRGMGEREIDKPKAAAAIRNADAKNDIVLSTIKRINDNDLVNVWTAGFIGKPLASISGSSAANLQSLISTIRANAGFDELQAMRDASPTGGALGQVAVQEIHYLQSVIANLENSQSPEQFKENLAVMVDAIMASKQRRRQAYDETYMGKEIQIPEITNPMEDPIDAELRRRGKM